MAVPKLSKRAAKLAGQVEEVAGEALTPGESVHIAVRVLTKGTVGGVAASSIGGAAGAIAGSTALERGSKEAEAAGFPGDNLQAIGLTDRALLFTDRTGMSGRPKSLRRVMPLGDVASVSHERGRMGDRLHMVLRSGAEITYTCVKVDPGAQFAAAVTERLT